MRETHRGDSYRPGDYWRECPVCGFEVLRSEMVTRWDGLLVCRADDDIRNPQDTPSYNHNFRPPSIEGMGNTSTLIIDWTTLLTTDLAAESTGATTRQRRNIYRKGADFTATGMVVRVTIKAHSSVDSYVDGVSIGIIDSATGRFMDAPTRITFSGSNNVIVAAGVDCVSDAVFFTVNGKNDIGVHVYFADSYQYATDTFGAGAFIDNSSSTDYTMVPDISGFTLSGNQYCISKIEVGN